LQQITDATLGLLALQCPRLSKLVKCCGCFMVFVAYIRPHQLFHSMPVVVYSIAQ